MLDKSPELILDNDLSLIRNQFVQNVPSIVLCSEPFHKAEFLNKLVNSEVNPVLIIDFDLLYSGYIKSGMIQEKNNVVIYNPNKDSWMEEISEIISKASSKSLIVIDSLNGIFTKFDDLDSSRFINSCIMLLSALGKQSQSTVVITAMARKKENEDWVLSPGGKQFMKSNTTKLYFVKKVEKNLIFSSLDDNNKITFKIEKNQK